MRVLEGRTKHQFQSTRPSRGETEIPPGMPEMTIISIHSPLAGRDRADRTSAGRETDFNPLAPRGARQAGLEHDGVDKVISIHSPLAGRDCCNNSRYSWQIYFNPLAPRGARQQKVIKYFLQKPFLLHNTHPYRFENRAYKKKNEVCLGEKRTCIGCEPIWNWVCTGGSHQRISGSSVERTGDTP